ncbi:hypothetical protein [Paenibacillus sp. OSY-SE]|uniref:hypothetical protein n=1 Tax=Paenibacillus sp. OSY-SE TaxID=1196323 RepID=UPI0003703CA4|nr:hypothetical protein [Paenibacillus sp. OSY-SE]
MKNSSLLGICLIALSGLEQILIYMANSESAGDSFKKLSDITPDYIWNIPMITLVIGILLIVVPLLIPKKDNTKSTSGKK